MKRILLKTVLICCIGIFFIGNMNARPHHHHGSKDLYKAAAIVDIVANSLIGLSVLSGNTSVITTPTYVTPTYVTPTPVYVAPTPVYVNPRPVYVNPRPVYVAPPSRIYHRPAPPPRRHHHGHRGRTSWKKIKNINF